MATGEAFGSLIRRYRRAAELTQEGLAERAGVSVRAVRDIETGSRHRPRVDTIELLLEALQVPEEDRAPFEAIERADGTWSRDPAPELPVGGFLGALPPTPMVGRERELQCVLQEVDAVAGGAGRLVLLTGEPGAGKTRLAQEITIHLRNRGFLLATGSCLASRQPLPYYPFLDILDTLFRLAPPALHAQAQSRWPYLGRLIPQSGILNPVDGAEGIEEQEWLFRAVTGFVQALTSDRPLALLLDDLHWADSSSLQLLQHLALQTRGNPVLLLGAYRDVEVGRRHALEGILRDLHRGGVLERVAVGRLAPEETRGLLAVALGDGEVSEAFTLLIHRHTDGNPFFTQEVLRSLVLRGDIYRDDGHWTGKSLDTIEVPDSIRSTIDERLSRLAEETQELLAAASVLGVVFQFEELLALGEWGEEEVEAGLMEGMGCGLLQERGQDTYAFSHALIQQGIYSDLPSRRRRRLHRAAGQVLELVPGRDTRLAELAWHFLEGNEPARAMRYALLAGDRAEAVYAHAEAEQQYRTALDLAGEGEDRETEAAALEKLGRVMIFQARFADALALLGRAAALWRVTGDTEGEARTIGQIGFAHRMRGTVDEGVTLLQTELERRQGDPPSSGLAAIHLNLSRMYFLLDDLEQGVANAERAAETARAVEDERTWAEAEVRRGVALQILGGIEESRRVLEAALAVSERIGDHTNGALGLDHLSGSYWLLGDFPRSLEYAQRSLQLSERIASPGFICTAAADVGFRLFFLGDWGGARSHLDRALELARSLGPSVHAFSPLACLGLLCLWGGAREEGLAFLDEALALARSLRNPALIRQVQLFRALWHLLEGRPAAASAHLPPVSAAGNDRLWLVHWVLAWAALERGDEEQAEEALALGLQKARWGGNRLEQMYLAWVQGMLRTRQRRWEEARSSLEEALSLSRDMPYPEGEARALDALGRLLAARDEMEAARRYLLAALSIFRRLGAQPDVERTEGALARLP